MFNISGQQIIGSVDNRRGALAERSYDSPSVSVWISKIIQIWDGRQKVAVEIQKTLCEGRNKENLIESTCFYLRTSRVQVFFPNCSQVRMFCDNECSKLAPGYTQSMEGTSWTIFDNLHEKIKSEYLTLEQKVIFFLMLNVHFLVSCAGYWQSFNLEKPRFA